MRVNQGQEFVIGGYTPGPKGFDALIFRVLRRGQSALRRQNRNGFTPASRAELCRRFRSLQTANFPFANLPEERGGRWGQGLTAEKMKECRWLKPVLVGLRVSRPLHLCLCRSLLASRSGNTRVPWRR